MNIRVFLLLLGLCLLRCAAFGQTFNVSIKNLAYDPPTITIPAGASVKWTNNEVFTSHTVTADDNSFDSGTLTAGATFTQTFNTPGTYNYHCNFHFSMHGTVIVTAPSTEVSPNNFIRNFGKILSGGLASLLTSDNNKLSMAAGPTYGSNLSWDLEFYGSSAATSGSELDFTLEMSCSRAGLVQTTYLRNYQTNQWDQVDSKACPLSDGTTAIVITTPNVAKYIKADGTVGARVTMRSTSIGSKNWNGSVDYVHWTIKA